MFEPRARPSSLLAWVRVPEAAARTGAFEAEAGGSEVARTLVVLDDVPLCIGGGDGGGDGDGLMMVKGWRMGCSRG